jgi:hypothetical protein
VSFGVALHNPWLLGLPHCRRNGETDMPILPMAGALRAAATCLFMTCTSAHAALAYEAASSAVDVAGIRLMSRPVIGAGLAQSRWDAPVEGWFLSTETPSLNVNANGLPPRVFDGDAMLGKPAGKVVRGPVTWTLTPSVGGHGAFAGADTRIGARMAVDQDLTITPAPKVNLSFGSGVTGSTGVASVAGTAAIGVRAHARARTALPATWETGSDLEFGISAARSVSQVGEVTSYEVAVGYLPSNGVPFRMRAYSPGGAAAMRLELGLQARF